MTLRAPVGLGDLIRAVRALEVSDPRELEAIAELLGVALPGHDTPIAAPEPRAPKVEERRTRQPSSSAETGPSVETPKALEPEQLYRPRLVERPPMAPRAPAWTREVVALSASRSLASVAMPHTPLFEPARTRSILSAALSTDADEHGSIDADALLMRLARGEPLSPVPWEKRAALSGSFQVLIDRGELMRPLFRDADELVRRMREVCGRERVRALRFDRDPTAGVGDGAIDEWSPWSPPPRGTTVVVLGDLGIGARDATAMRSWVQLSTRAAAAGCRVVAMVPHPPALWPERLARAIALLHWDRRETVGRARRAARSRRVRGR